MRKIHVLKAIVDFIWFVSYPILFLGIIFIIALFFSDTFNNKELHLLNTEILINNVFSKVLISVLVLTVYLILYCVYLFRKVLTYFLRAKIFDVFVLKTLNKIGKLLTTAGSVSLINSLLLIYLYKQKLFLGFGLSPHLIIICLGLFFMVLSEVFTIAKKAKQENDLTI